MRRDESFLRGLRERRARRKRETLDQTLFLLSFFPLSLSSFFLVLTMTMTASSRSLASSRGPACACASSSAAPAAPRLGGASAVALSPGPRRRRGLASSSSSSAATTISSSSSSLSSRSSSVLVRSMAQQEKAAAANESRWQTQVRRRRWILSKILLADRQLLLSYLFSPPLIRPRVASLSLSLSPHPLSRPPLRPNENHHYLHHHPHLHLLPHLHRSERAASSPSPRRRRGSSSGRTRGGSSSTCARRPRSRGPPSGARCARRSTSPRRSTRCRT